MWVCWGLVRKGCFREKNLDGLWQVVLLSSETQYAPTKHVHFTHTIITHTPTTTATVTTIGGFSLKLRRFLWLVVIEVVGQESCQCSALAACSSAPLTSYLRAGRGLQECCRSAIGSRDSPASSLVFVLLTLPPPRPPPRASTTGQGETPSRRQLLFGEPKC